MLLVSCSDTPPPPVDTSAADQKAIRDGEVAWNGDFAAKDPARLASHYADDASLMVPDLPLMKGKDAILSGLKTMMADKNLTISFATASVDVSKAGDIAYSQGAYSMTATNPKTKKVVAEKGKYVTVYKKQADGKWKAIADIDNADAPAVPVVGPRVARVSKKAPVVRKKKK